MYLFVAVIESTVLRATNDLKVWRAVIVGLLIADLGHVLSVKEEGWEVYYKVGRWNEMDWGNLGFVYFAAAVRVMFLLGVGLGESGGSSRQGGKKDL